MKEIKFYTSAQMAQYSEEIIGWGKAKGMSPFDLCTFLDILLDLLTRTHGIKFTEKFETKSNDA